MVTWVLPSGHADRQLAVAADLGQSLGQPVGQGGMGSGIVHGVSYSVAEHQPLVTGALQVQRVRPVLDPGLVGPVDAHGDVGDWESRETSIPRRLRPKPWWRES
jgi:hypothetical protein